MNVSRDNSAKEAVDIVDEELIERVWGDLNGRVPRDQIHQVAMAIAAEFQNAKVQRFLPILIYRRTLAHLKEAIDTQGR